MQLYRGTVDLALECNADIIPVAIEQYDQMFWINIGDSISADDMNCHDREQLTECVRDALAALKWEIWEQQGIVQRECIPLNFLAKKMLRKINSRLKAINRSTFIGEGNRIYIIWGCRDK